MIDSAAPSHRHPQAAKDASWLHRARLALEKGGASPFSLGFILLCGAMGYLQAGLYGIWVFGLLFTVGYEFQKRLDQGLPLMQVAALLATLQWTVGPYLAYSLGYDYERYYMYVGEDEYFRFALPGAAAFAFGLLALGSSVKMRELLEAVPRGNFLNIGLALNGLALAGRFAAGSAPGSLAFILHLVSVLSYVGILYILYSGSPQRWWLSALCLLPLLQQTTESAMFHDLILWAGLIFCYWFSQRQHTMREKVVLLLFAGFSLFTIQAVKQSYRGKVWKGQGASLSEEITDFWISDEDSEISDAFPNVVQRLNQGWIISAVMNHVPSEEPYAEGETLVDAVYAAFVPRFLTPEKAKSGGQINFRRFTGLDLADKTSMAVSPLGEGYANFGVEGGILLMLGFGLGFSAFYAFCLQWALLRPDFVFWIPLIFYQAIKAETEFVTVLNQLSKGAVVAFAGYWALHRQFAPAPPGKTSDRPRRAVGFQPGPGAGFGTPQPARQTSPGPVAARALVSESGGGGIAPAGNPLEGPPRRGFQH